MKNEELIIFDCKSLLELIISLVWLYSGECRWNSGFRFLKVGFIFFGLGFFLKFLILIIFCVFLEVMMEGVFIFLICIDCLMIFLVCFFIFMLKGLFWMFLFII